MPRLACSSLSLLGIMVSCGGCIVLGDPQYEDPEQTAPRITPLTRPEELILSLSEPDGSWLVPFFVEIESEDAGEKVRLALLRNFGGGVSGNRPYDGLIQQATLEPSTLRAGARSVDLEWFEAGAASDYSCSSVTLLATHQFREGAGSDFFCPANSNDVDTVTWIVLRCRTPDENCSFDLCNEGKPTEPNYCNPPEDG